MKCAFFIQALLPWSGGCAISEGSLARSLKERISTTILCQKGAVDTKFARSLGIEEIVEYELSDLVRAWLGMSSKISDTVAQADVVHLNGHWRLDNFVVSRLCVRLNKPFILEPRGMLLVGQRSVFVKRLYNFLLGNRLVGAASRLIALSQYEIEQFEPYDVEVDRIAVVPNGVSPPPGEREDGQLSAELKGPFFLYLGRLESRKNLVFLLAAFREYLHQKGAATLHFVGPPERGYDRTLADEIKRLELTERAFIHAPVYGKDKWRLMEKAVAVIYPTLDEPFGRVPFETLWVGGYPIVPSESGSREYIENFLPGCVYQHESQESLVKAMFFVETQRTSGQNESLQKAQHWVKEELTWSRIADVVLDVYDEVLKVDHKEKPKEIVAQ